MEGLIEFYNIVDLGLICKRIIMKSHFKIRFWIKVKYECFLERKLNEKWH